MEKTQTSWEQLTLTQPRAVEITLKVGLAAFADHAQYQLEVRNADDGELLVLRSRPHVDWSKVWSELDVWLDLLRESIEVHDNPF